VAAGPGQRSAAEKPQRLIRPRLELESPAVGDSQGVFGLLLYRVDWEGGREVMDGCLRLTIAYVFGRNEDSGNSEGGKGRIKDSGLILMKNSCDAH